MNNNKLIAEFMGKEIYQKYHESNYHKSWDWLMPVIAKILDICFQDEGDAKDFYSVRDCIPNREATYYAVVEFIKLYNKNQNKDE